MNKIYYILLIVLLFFSNSCTDIITLDLKTSEPKIIIEANLTASDSTCTVKVTKSNSFYDNTSPEKVSDLNIVLTKNSSENFYLTEIEDGEYFIEDIVANPKDEFSISITDSNDVSYNASAITPSNPGPFLVIFKSPFEDEDIIVPDSNGVDRVMLMGLAFWLDIPNEENFFRFKIYINDKYQDDFIFLDDKQADQDSNKIQMGLGRFFVGDTATIKLLTINEDTYDYFLQLDEVIYSSMNSTTPYNPKSNFDNDALGYFCIQQVVEQEFIVQKFPSFKK
ncbi:MAG: DUF4249 family protein [Bacteroidota bacterium]|nr:DUF4249 family protein [Bacteroidota bacterium]